MRGGQLLKWSNNMSDFATWIRSVKNNLHDDFGGLPEASRAFLIHYGIEQLVNDSHVAGKTQLEKTALVEKKLKKVYDGTLDIRDAAPRDIDSAELRKFAGKATDKFFKKQGTPAKDIPAEAWKAKVAEYMEDPKVIAAAKASADAIRALDELEM
jgi:hypothetical protein